MKKLFSGLVALACLVALSTMAFAASDTTLLFDLTCDGEHQVTVPTGTTITVSYTVENLTTDAEYIVNSIQNEIYWDNHFFELDETSVVMYMASNAGDHTSSEFKHYMYFNDVYEKTYQGATLVGTFDLTVIAENDGDSTWIRNTAYRASDVNFDSFDTECENLQVIVGDPDATYYTLSFDTNGGSAISAKAVAEGATVKLSDYTTTRSGYEFDGWYSDEDLTDKVTSFTMTGDTTVYAAWEKESSGGGGGSSTTTYYDIAVTSEGNGDVDPDGTVSVAKYGSQTFTFTPDAGYEVSDVLVNGTSVGAVVSYKFTSVTSDHTLHVVFAKDDGSSGATLNRDDHMAYMQGYTDGTFGPSRNITRAEATVMFSRLLTETMDMDTTYAVSYADMTGDEWYANAVGFMSEFGIINGYTDGTFGGNDAITRAEFATIASRFDALVASDADLYSDVPESYWAYSYINSAATKGWITGYTDGTFQPEWNISRAEAVTLVNRVLGRSADLDFIADNLEDLNTYTDVPTSYWAYGAVMEASNGHDYDFNSDGSETWTGLK